MPTKVHLTSVPTVSSVSARTDRSGKAPTATGPKPVAARTHKLRRIRRGLSGGRRGPPDPGGRPMLAIAANEKVTSHKHGRRRSKRLPDGSKRSRQRRARSEVHERTTHLVDDNAHQGPPDFGSNGFECQRPNRPIRKSPHGDRPETGGRANPQAPPNTPGVVRGPARAP